MALSVGNGPGAIQLQAGDVLVERYHGGATHAAITAGQAFGSIFGGGGQRRSSKSVHAAIYSEDTHAGGFVIESVGSGLRESEIGPGRPANKRVHWKVYRFITTPAIADLAVDIGITLVKRAFEDPNRFGGGHGNAYGKYTKGSSFASAFKSANNAPPGGAQNGSFDALAMQRGFFCSNFVVACFAVASELSGQNTFYAIPKNMENVNPSELDAYFKTVPGSWPRLGGGGVYLDA